jgi:hypothetical protein
LVVLALIAAATLPYLPFLSLPFISDDYTQIRLAREYGPVSGWPALAADPLYRCRATSLVFTYWIDWSFGLNPHAHNAAALLLHVLNTGLVALAGLWHRIGWRISLPAAFFFAVYEGHQEAVVWTAAVPELLVFFFAGTAFLLWTAWLSGTGRGSWKAVAAVAGFALALLSKESGVAALPLMAAAWLIDKPRRDRAWIPLAACSVLTVIYIAGVFQTPPADHLHLRDGTFQWRSPFWLTLPNSLVRMLWIWGLAALCALAALRTRTWRHLAAGSLAWMIVTLAPYSFLTYMTRVPSRHTYLASAGLAILVGLAWTSVALRTPSRWAMGLLASLLLVHNIGYLWVKKLTQYERRAEPTRRFLDFARRQPGPILVRCAPYGVDVLRDTAWVELGRQSDTILEVQSKIEGTPTPVEYCDMEHP